MNGINLVSLDKSADYTSKLQSLFTEKISEIKQNSNTQVDALGTESVVKVEISALGAEELEKARQSWNNHPVSSLYRTDIPISTNAEGMYRIGKVDFSEEEFESARNLVTGIASQLKQGTLGYGDHTKMALAESLADKCASVAFSDDQRQVIVKAMKDYNEKLINQNNELLSTSNYVENNDESAKQYWGLRAVIPEAAKDAMQSLFGRRPTATTAVTSVATNSDLIEALQQKIKEVDLTDKEGMDKFKSYYKAAMKPVYDAQYPEEMRSNSKSSIEQDLYGSAGITKMVDFAKQWLSQNQ